MSSRQQGSVARILYDRAFGFIHSIEDRRDYFFHQENLLNCGLADLRAGDLVEFEVTTRNGKVQADEVNLVQSAPVKGERSATKLPVDPERQRARRKA